MRIAVWHNLPSGGGKRALYYHVRGLIERGHTVEAWCPPSADQSYLPLSDLIREHIVPLPWQSRSAKNPFDKLMADYHKIADKIKAMNEHCLACAEVINSAEFDLLFANSCCIFGTSAIGHFINIPKALYLQEPYRWFYEALPQLPWIALPPVQNSWWSSSHLKTLLKDLLKIQGLRVQVRQEWLNAKAFDLILANSSYSRESILRAYGLNAKVCYLGIDPELFRPTGVRRENFVVGLGSIDLPKGIDRAILALETISETKRPKLIWIGNFANQTYQNKMEALAASVGVNLCFKKRLSDEEVVDLLNRATALIYTPRLEPFGFAPLEANACGTPVIAIAEGGIRETIQAGINGFLVNDNDPVAIGQAILKLLENQNLVQEIGKKARDYVVNNWTWDSALDRLEKTFLQLLLLNKNLEQNSSESY